MPEVFEFVRIFLVICIIIAVLIWHSVAEKRAMEKYQIEDQKQDYGFMGSVDRQITLTIREMVILLLEVVRYFLSKIKK